MHRIESLFIYPIKSFAGISMQTCHALGAGFEYDRRWMLIDGNNRFISQREYPKLALFKVNLSTSSVHILYEGDEVGFDKTLSFGATITATVWGDQAVVKEVNVDVSNWLSERIGAEVRLVKLQGEQARLHHSGKLSTDIHVSLADGYPYLVLSEKTVEHLNTQLQTPVLMNRFRPNIVISTSAPHEEDVVGQLTFGDTIFQNVKPCGRCVMINNNQEAATMGKEPLATLSGYRKQGNSVLFGSNFICTHPGVVEVGMVSKNL